MRFFQVFLGILVPVLFFSCKKEVDEVPPTIEVTNPVKNTTYNTFDTIYINAVLKDDQVLTFGSAELQDANLITILKPISRELNTNEYRMNVGLVIDDLHIKSGKHYVLISASDKDNTTRNFTTVSVNGLPLFTKGYMVFEKTGGQINLHNYYLTGDSILWVNPGPFKDGLVDNYYQQAGYLKGPEGTFFTHPLYPFIDPWELPSDQGGILFCRSQPDQPGIQIGYKNGILAIFINEGNLRKTYLSEQTYFPKLSLINGNNVIVWQVQESQTQNKIEVFFIDGAIRQVNPFNQSMINMVNKSENEIYIGSNDNGDGNLSDYGLSDGLFHNIYHLSDEPIVAMCQGKKGLVYFSTSKGIYKYDSNQSNPIEPSAISGIKAIHMDWDFVNEILIATTNNKLYFLGAFGDVLQTKFLQGEPKKLQIWYSK